jgi:hypothetical protein
MLARMTRRLLLLALLVSACSAAAPALDAGPVPDVGRDAWVSCSDPTPAGHMTCNACFNCPAPCGTEGMCWGCGANGGWELRYFECFPDAGR